jgi:hypothetical protein
LQDSRSKILRRRVQQAILVSAVTLASHTRASASPRIFPTGVTVYEPARAYNSFVCFSALDGKTHLVDMDGNQVHQWSRPGVPGEVIDPKLVGGQRGVVLQPVQP